MPKHSPIAFQIKRHLTLSLYLLPLIRYWEYSPQARRGSEETYTKQNFPGGSLAFSPPWSPADVLTHCPSTQGGFSVACIPCLGPQCLQWLVPQFLAPGPPTSPAPQLAIFLWDQGISLVTTKKQKLCYLKVHMTPGAQTIILLVPRLKDCPLFLEGKRGRLGLPQPLLPGSINTFQWGHFSFNSSFAALSLLCLNKIYHLTTGM